MGSEGMTGWFAPSEHSVIWNLGPFFASTWGIVITALLLVASFCFCCWIFKKARDDNWLK